MRTFYVFLFLFFLGGEGGFVLFLNYIMLTSNISIDLIIRYRKYYRSQPYIYKETYIIDLLANN